MARGMAVVWLVALVWLGASGAISYVRWQSWSEQHPVTTAEDCSPRFPPSSADLAACYQGEVQSALDRRVKLTLHVAIPLGPAVMLVLFAAGLGWVQRF